MRIPVLLASILLVAFSFGAYAGPISSEYEAYRLISTASDEFHKPNRTISNGIILMRNDAGTGFFLITQDGEGYFVESANRGFYQIRFPNGDQVSFSYEMVGASYHPIQSIHENLADYFERQAIQVVLNKRIYTEEEFLNAVEQLNEAQQQDVRASVKILTNMTKKLEAQRRDDEAREHLRAELKGRVESMVARLEGIEEAWNGRWSLLESQAKEDLSYGRWSPVHLGGMRDFYRWTEAIMSTTQTGIDAVKDLGLEGLEDLGDVEDEVVEIRTSQANRYRSLREKFLKYNDPKVQKKERLSVPEYSNYGWDEEGTEMIYMPPKRDE